jgi:hypothetical protein
LIRACVSRLSCIERTGRQRNLLRNWWMRHTRGEIPIRTSSQTDQSLHANED